MKRFKILFGQRRFQVLATMAVVLLAVSVVIASGANFTATSANPGNVFTAGTLTIGNTKADGTTSTEGTLVDQLTAANMKPGDVVTGTVKIKNTGSISGTFALTAAVSTGTGFSSTFSHDLTLKVTEDSTQIYSGAFDAMPATPLTSGAAWAAAAVHTYVFTVTFPNGTPTNDNPFQGAKAQLNLTWTATQS